MITQRSGLTLSIGSFFVVLAGLIGGPSAAEDSLAPSGGLRSSLTVEEEAKLLEELSAIGYVAGSEPAGESRGVILREPERVSPGLNLMTSGHAPVALLMQTDGTVVHEWTAEFDEIFADHPRSDRSHETRRNFWRKVILFPNGDIVIIWELFGIFRLDRDSNVLWVVPEPAHHDLQLNEAGEIVHLQAERKMISGIPEKQAIEDFVVVRNTGGEEIRRVALSDALSNVNWLNLRRTFWLRAEERAYGLDSRSAYDPFHTNSLQLLGASGAALLGGRFQAGDALVSMGMLDTVAIIDLEKGVTRWSQQGPFGMQHSARLSPEGEIVLFNNFSSAKRSSVMTLNPRTRDVTREYQGPDSKHLYSRRSGGVQLLPNGNMLITETDGGRALEIADGGDVVWEFHSPYRVEGEPGQVAHLYSLERIDESRADWLDREAQAGSGD